MLGVFWGGEGTVLFWGIFFLSFSFLGWGVGILDFEKNICEKTFWRCHKDTKAAKIASPRTP